MDRDDAIIAVPGTKKIPKGYGRDEELDLTTPEGEYAALMFPVADVFDWDAWQDGFDSYWSGIAGQGDQRKATFRLFKKQVLENFKNYDVPVIALGAGTSKEAVCVVFEKVNTGGKALDAFELVTAMFAADGHELRRDWYGKDGVFGRQHRLAQSFRPADREAGILAQVSATDFLHAVSLFYTRSIRRAAEVDNKAGKELPAVSGNRAALLNLPLDGYLQYQAQVEQGFVRAAKFLHMLHIYRVFDLPYQTQIVPLAAILADIGDKWEHQAIRAKLVRWYWNGVFGELYGSAVESRIARDFLEVPLWLEGGDTPGTIRDATFRAERLKTMRMRISAAYKGVNVLLMNAGARDFRSGQEFDHTVFFGEDVDIHHIFPKKWCEQAEIEPRVYDSIINKTPLSSRTNRMLGGVAPSRYLAKLQQGNSETPSIASAELDIHLRSHAIDPATLRNDDFSAFMTDRADRLLRMIEEAMGQRVYQSASVGDEDEIDDETAEADMTLASA